jgi:collagen triple helix repeat protein
MKRLRHPVRAIREPFGTAGLVVACIALIAALGGTALAAKGALTGKQRKEVEKIAKKFAGKPGAPGAQGPAGAAGKDGSNGTNGTNGKDGAPGSAGAPGAPGKSVVVKALEPGEEGALEECEERGGSEIEVEGAGGAEAEICNGGPGPEGSPWTDGGTLPPGATETGAWSINGTTADTNGVYAPISFTIPLAASITGEGGEEEEDHIHYSTDADFGTFCAEPAIEAGQNQPDALPGEMCIWQIEGNNATFDGITPASVHGESELAAKFGATLHFSISGVAFAAGSWAVTGCAGSTGPTKCP